MPFSHRTILYVDDDADDQFLILETLALLAPTVSVVATANGVETLSYLEGLENGSLPALIILDINMPLLDGKETLIKIREQDRFNHIPIVLFTTSSSHLDTQFSTRYNVPFVTKPATNRELELVVKQMLEQVGSNSAVAPSN